MLADPAGKQLVNLLRPYGAPLPDKPARPDMFVPVVRDRRPTIGPVVPHGPIIHTPTFAIHQQRVPPDAVVSILDARGNHVARSREHEQWLAKPASGPDVVDVGLPRLDGYELARRIRASGRNDMFLVAVTGYGQPEARRRGLDAGFDAYLTKPIAPDRLMEVIATASPGGHRSLGGA